MSSDFSPDQQKTLSRRLCVRHCGGARGARQKLCRGAGRGGEAWPAVPTRIPSDAGPGAGGRRHPRDQGKFKREPHPFDGDERLKQQALFESKRRKPADNFRWRYYGLFTWRLRTACTRCRTCAFPTASSSTGNLPVLPILPSDRYGGGYSHITTRANLQIREVEPKNAVNMLEAITDLGLCSRGTGADNIRNVTGMLTAWY